MMTHDQINRAARAWLEWGDESYDNAVAMVAKAIGTDATVVSANLAAITERACFLRAEDAKKLRHVRSQASRKGARSRQHMREARGG
jgi:hypothetical protein